MYPRIADQPDPERPSLRLAQIPDLVPVSPGRLKLHLESQLAQLPQLPPVQLPEYVGALSLSASQLFPIAQLECAVDIRALQDSQQQLESRFRGLVSGHEHLQNGCAGFFSPIREGCFRLTESFCSLSLAASQGFHE